MYFFFSYLEILIFFSPTYLKKQNHDPNVTNNTFPDFPITQAGCTKIGLQLYQSVSNIQALFLQMEEKKKKDLMILYIWKRLSLTPQTFSWNCYNAVKGKKQ